jgi:Bacterial PH domain
VACGVVAAALGLFALFGCWLAAIDDDLSGRWIWFMLMEAVLLLPAWVAFRCARAGLLLRVDAIIVRNPFRTVTVRWEDLDSISVGPRGMFSRIMVLNLRNRDVVSVFGIQGSNPRCGRDDKCLQPLIAELETRLGSDHGNVAFVSATR